MFGESNFGGSDYYPTTPSQSNNPGTTTNTADGGGGAGAASYIQAISGLIQAFINRNESKKSAKRNMNNAMAIAEHEFNLNRQMWELQNQYNTPGSQMQRLSQAGLNPNLVYGSGNVSGNQSGAPPSYRGRTVDMSYTPLQIPDVIGMYQNFAMRQAQINNVKAATNATQVKTTNEALRSGLLETLGKKTIFELDRDQQLAPYQVDKSRADAKRAGIQVDTEFQRLKNLSVDEQNKILQSAYMQKRMDIQEIEKEKKQAELLFLQYKNELREQGIHEGDNILLRIITRMVNESGFDLGGFLEGFEQYRQSK